MNSILFIATLIILPIFLYLYLKPSKSTSKVDINQENEITNKENQIIETNETNNVSKNNKLNSSIYHTPQHSPSPQHVVDAKNVEEEIEVIDDVDEIEKFDD